MNRRRHSTSVYPSQGTPSMNLIAPAGPRQSRGAAPLSPTQPIRTRNPTTLGGLAQMHLPRTQRGAAGQPARMGVSRPRRHCLAPPSPFALLARLAPGRAHGCHPALGRPMVQEAARLHTARGAAAAPRLPRGEPLLERVARPDLDRPQATCARAPPTLVVCRHLGRHCSGTGGARDYLMRLLPARPMGCDPLRRPAPTPRGTAPPRPPAACLYGRRWQGRPQPWPATFPAAVDFWHVPARYARRREHLSRREMWAVGEKDCGRAPKVPCRKSPCWRPRARCGPSPSPQNPWAAAASLGGILPVRFARGPEMHLSPPIGPDGVSL